MSKEWSSPYNPFNSAKILLWAKYIEACIKQDYLIPPMVDIDLSPKCNYLCNFCNANGIIEKNQSYLPTEHFLKLADFLKNWRLPGKEERVLSVCISGGGESLMHPGYKEILERLDKHGIEIGLITNGSLLKQEKDLSLIAKTCKWVGFSMDAATPLTYNKIKLQNYSQSSILFDNVCNNLRKLAINYHQLNKVNGTCFKFLLSHDNYKEIYLAAKLAKFLGVHDFHLRPVSYLNIVNNSKNNTKYTKKMLNIINSQLNRASELEDETFKVYGVKHKFTDDFQPILKFKKCRLIPMLPTFGADGYVHTCFDIRGRKDLIMCKHFELEQYWNSIAHKQQINSIDITKCPRCTMNAYHEACEKVFIEDNMYRNFL
jgi:MoaA/NifB/PqqE/SkfB family radical SAM enzyme